MALPGQGGGSQAPGGRTRGRPHGLPRAPRVRAVSQSRPPSREEDPSVWAKPAAAPWHVGEGRSGASAGLRGKGVQSEAAWGVGSFSKFTRRTGEDSSTESPTAGHPASISACLCSYICVPCDRRPPQKK